MTSSQELVNYHAKIYLDGVQQGPINNFKLAWGDVNTHDCFIYATGEGLTTIQGYRMIVKNFERNDAYMSIYLISVNEKDLVHAFN